MRKCYANVVFCPKSKQISISDFIRRAAINKQVRVYKPPPQVNQEFYQELSAIGVNLNQLVRAMNTAIASGQTITNVEEALFLVEEVLKLVKQLQEELLEV